MPEDKVGVGSTGESVSSGTTVAGTGVVNEPTKPDTKPAAWLLELEAAVVEEAVGAGGGTAAGVGKAAREDVGVVRSDMARSG